MRIYQQNTMLYVGWAKIVVVGLRLVMRNVKIMETVKVASVLLARGNAAIKTVLTKTVVFAPLLKNLFPLPLTQMVIILLMLEI
jgi:hypothetical protein